MIGFGIKKCLRWPWMGEILISKSKSRWFGYAVCVVIGCDGEYGLTLGLGRFEVRGTYEVYRHGSGDFYWRP